MPSPKMVAKHRKRIKATNKKYQDEKRWDDMATFLRLYSESYRKYLDGVNNHPTVIRARRQPWWKRMWN